MINLLYYDAWSGKNFWADSEKTRKILNKVCKETNKKIYAGELIYMTDIMNYIYRELGLPECNDICEFRRYMHNRNNVNFFQYDLDPYDDGDEIQWRLYTYFE